MTLNKIEFSNDDSFGYDVDNAVYYVEINRKSSLDESNPESETVNEKVRFEIDSDDLINILSVVANKKIVSATT